MVRKKAKKKRKLAKRPAKKTKKQVHWRKRMYPFWPFGWVIFVALLVIDQYTKRAIHSALLEGQTAQVFPGLWFTRVHNTGANWGLFQDSNTILVVLSIIAFAVLVYYRKEFKTLIEKLCYVLLMVGLWGNLLDRVLLQYVVDFIDLGWWPVFNIADSAIVVGIIVVLLEQWRKSRYSTKA